MSHDGEGILGEELEDGEELFDLTGQAGSEDEIEEGEDDDEHDDEDQQARGDFPMLEDESIHCFEGHTDSVLAVAWSPAHPDLVATGGQDDLAFLWRVGQDALESTAGTLSTYELSGHTDSVASIGFNCTGTLVATGGMEGIVKVWNTTDGQLIKSLEGPSGSIDWLKWHPKGDVVLAGSEDFTMWMWQAQTGNCMQVFSGHQGPITSGEFTPDGKCVVSTGGDEDCSLRVWNPKTSECTAHVHGHGFHGDSGITSCAIHSDSSTVITGAEDGTVRLYNIASGRILGALQGHEDSVETVGFSSHLPLAASAGVDGKLLVFDLNVLCQRGSPSVHPDAVTRMAWHPLQPLVVTACLDGIVRCWDLRTGTQVKQFGGHSAGLLDVALSPDGSMVISGGDDNTARVFSMAA